MEEIINFLLIAGVIQGFGFNLVTIFIKKKFNIVVIFLNLIILFISLNNLQRWLIENGFSSDLFLLKNLLIPWYVLVLPMFYAFTIHFLRVQHKVNGFMKFSIALFITEIVIRLCLISYVHYEVPDRDTSLINRYTTFEELFNLVYSIFLFINTCLIVFRRHHLIAYILTFDDLNWIKWFIRLGSCVIFFWAVAVVIKTLTGDETAYLPLRFSTSILLYWMGYQGFYKYNVVQDRIFLRNSLANNEVLISSDTENQLLDQKDEVLNEKHQKEFETIKDYIIKNKLYLNPLLSMETVTDEVGISKSHLSKLVNTYSNHNFSDFVNSLRIEQAKKFLSNDDFSAYTIVAVGLECGFNSKSTFYSAFKKFTSETPSSFRDKF